MISFILSLAILILLAKVFGELSEKIHLPSLVGEILAGILLGPAILNMMGDVNIFKFFAEIGIILLVFIAGFEHGSIKDLLKYKSASILVSVMSSTIPVIVVIVFSLTQGYTLLTSLFLAVALGATSMGISVRSLMAVNEIDSRAGKTVIGSLVLNDITGLILLTGVAGYAGIATGGGGSMWWEIVKVLISVAIFFGIFFIGFMYLPRLTTIFMHLKVEEAQFSLAIIIVLISAWAASNFGLSSIIGAFFCGIVLSKSPIFENHTFVQKISSISYGFFIPIFFAYTGAQLSFNNLSINLLRALKFLGIVTLIQVGCGFIGSKINKYSTKESFLVGFGMLPYGEVTLVVMSSLVSLSSLQPQFFIGEDIQGIFSSMLLLILMSIILTPILMMAVERLFKSKRKKNVRTI